MRKAIQLKATVVITGDAEPAADFARITTRALRDVLKAGASRHPELKITVKRIIENRDDEETDESGGADEE